MWHSQSLRMLAHVEYGKSPNEVRHIDGIYPIYGTGGFQGTASKFLFAGEGIVVGRKGTLSNPFFVKDKYWVIDTAYAVLPFDEVNAKWLYYNLSMYDLTKLNEATGVPSINRDYLYDVSFQVPEFKCQKAIVDVIETIDSSIKETESLISKYKKIKQGIMQDLFTRGVDKNGRIRPDYTEAPELYKECELGWIPKEWEYLPFETLYLLPIRDFGSFSMTNLIDFVEDGIPFIKSEDVQEGFLEKSNISYITPKVHSLLHKSKVNKGDILFTKIGAICRCVIYDGSLGECNSNAATAKIKLNEQKADDEFIKYTLLSDSVKNRFEKYIISTPPRINLGDINALKIKIPKIEEQKLIGKILKIADGKILNEKRLLVKLNQLKQGLMQDLLTGKVRVKTQEGQLV